MKLIVTFAFSSVNIHFGFILVPSVKSQTFRYQYLLYYLGNDVVAHRHVFHTLLGDEI